MTRLFDDVGEGFITVERFREILKEIDEEISEDELDGIIGDVSIPTNILKLLINITDDIFISSSFSLRLLAEKCK